MAITKEGHERSPKRLLRSLTNRLWDGRIEKEIPHPMANNRGKNQFSIQDRPYTQKEWLEEEIFNRKKQYSSYRRPMWCLGLNDSSMVKEAEHKNTHW
jgi:hypothetical protein